MTTSKSLLLWTPRILTIIFAALISMFALDVFGAGYGFWKTVLALLVHLIPTFIILVILALSWRWEWIGGVIFVALAALYIIAFWGRFHWSVYVIMSGSLFLLGILFLINWVKRDWVRGR